MQNIEVEIPQKKLGFSLSPTTSKYRNHIDCRSYDVKGKEKRLPGWALCFSATLPSDSQISICWIFDFRFIKRQAQSHTLVVATQTPFSDDQRRVVQRGTSQSRENLWPYLYTSPGTWKTLRTRWLDPE